MGDTRKKQAALSSGLIGPRETDNHFFVLHDHLSGTRFAVS
jgi:hypothetical protein